MKLSTKEIILITLAVALGGPGTAQAILSIASKYIEKKLAKYFQRDLNEETFWVFLNRLKRDGLLERKSKGIWNLTVRGWNEVGRIKRRVSYEHFKAKNKGNNTIIVFDVPECHRKKRDYLRVEIAALGFKQLQKSVWIGGGPLPLEFIKYLKETRSLDYVHIFTIKGFGTVK